MNPPITILEELQSLESTLPSGLPPAPYAVPEGYFESLPALMLGRVRTENASPADEIESLSPLLAGLSRKMPFAVPENYFAQSSEDLEAISGPEESHVLSFISKDMPYEVPSGYFAQFPERMLDKASGRTGAKVVPMRRRWMQVAAAAIVAGLVTLSGIAYFTSNGKSSPASPAPIAQELKKASTEELNAFLNTTDVSAGVPVTAVAKVAVKPTSPKAAPDVKTLLEDVSDKDINAFLDQMPVDEEEAGIN